MVAWIVLAVTAVLLAILYFFMTKVGGLPAHGAWLPQYRYAHRGLHNAEFPENSMGAFKNAVAHGCAIELDVHLSGDGVVVVYHDDTLERLTGHTGKVEDYTFVQLNEMKLDGSVYAIPSLEEVLAAVGGAVPILIETKNEGGAGALEEKLYALLETYRGKYAVQSFSPFSIGWFRKHAPEVLRGQLSSNFREGATHIAWIKRFMIRHLLTNFLCRPHFISYDKDGVGRPVARRLRKEGCAVLAWTIHSKAEQEQTAAFADTIIFENFQP